AWRLIGKLEKEYRIDDRRLYLTGISSGAFGAYVLVMDHPDAFAALVPVCGAANP
ncbi:MAG TPA: phospholipase, partial [Sarcina sp.]|nr:phospholipase [Sarcina sp.]